MYGWIKASLLWCPVLSVPQYVCWVSMARFFGGGRDCRAGFCEKTPEDARMSDKAIWLQES